MPSARTLPDLFLKRVQATPDRVAFTFPRGDDWQSLTWRQTAERVRAIAGGLRALGVKEEERCALLGGTRIEWVLCDLGILCAGAATTTIYPSNTPEECAFIVRDSGTVLVIAEDDKQVAKLMAKRAELSTVRKVIVIDGKADGDWVTTLADLEEKGRAWDQANAGKLDAIAGAVKPDSLATLIYTSGTTGRPKGVELTHDCWVFVGHGIEELGILSIDDLQYLWLPLAHSFGKVLEAAQLQIGFETAIDGRVPKLIENLALVKPTFMAAAPRIFEKVYNKVVTGAQEKGGFTYKVFRWAMGVGREVSQRRRAGESLGLWLGFANGIADRLVFSTLRKRFGGRLRFFISGSAPLSREMAEFFHAAGILILEGYGLTESSAASVVNRVDDFAFGTVGKPVPGVGLRLAEDGEVLLGGRGIMRGYHGLPKDTAETLTVENGTRWLKTGDIGEIDDRGRLRITDRKKDLIKTSGGKYVVPSALESKLKSKSPYISQVVVHGDNRNFCTALVTLDEETIGPWLRERGLDKLSREERARHPEVRAMVKAAVDALNRELASYESIKDVAILENDLSIEEGELTASMKVKRKFVEKKYKSVLDAFYTGAMARE
jgi:long-chain acyl-CoA synthetase